MKFNKLLTHEHPDLDAMMSALLMKKFGEDKFPGVSNAEIIFSSANTLPGNKTTKQLEKEGILALDIGGGRFDTHPVGNVVSNKKRERSATDLVADELGIINNPNWKELVRYTRMQDTTGHSLFSRDYLHHLVSIHTIILGLNIIYKGDSKGILQNGIKILENIPTYVEHINDDYDHIQILQELFTLYFEKYNIKIDNDLVHFTNFSKWFKRLSKNPSNSFSKNKLDDLVSLKAIIIGAYFGHFKEMDKVFDIFDICLTAILKREEQWFKALKEFEDKAIIKKIGEISVVGIESDNGVIIKVARFQGKSDLLLYRSPKDGAITIFINRNGPLNKFHFNKLAAKIRLVESLLTNETPDYNNLIKVGTINGWFLHQSENMLIKGSPKATNFTPSKIPFNELIEIVCYSVDRKKEREYNIPLNYLKLFLEFENPIFRRS